MTTPPSLTPAHAEPIEPDIARALTSAQAGEAPSPVNAARIKRSLLHRIAIAEERHLTVTAAAAGWSPFLPGVDIRVLHESGGVMSYLLKLAPGASVPAHRHPHDEECVVLEGVLHIGDLQVSAGDYHLARRNALHAALHSPTGSTIFLRGATPSLEQAL